MIAEALGMLNRQTGISDYSLMIRNSECTREKSRSVTKMNFYNFFQLDNVLCWSTKMRAFTLFSNEFFCTHSLATMQLTVVSRTLSTAVNMQLWLNLIKFIIFTVGGVYDAVAISLSFRRMSGEIYHQNVH